MIETDLVNEDLEECAQCYQPAEMWYQNVTTGYVYGRCPFHSHEYPMDGGVIRLTAEQAVVLAVHGV